jgi:predicted DNA-binding protein with PD1-like motif
VRITGSGSVGLLVLAAEPGEDIVPAATAALLASGAPFAWVVARGTLREALVDTGPRASASTRAIEGTTEIASASGVWRSVDGTLSLSGVLAREIDRGADAVAGRLVSAVAEQAELICFLVSAPEAAPVARPTPPAPPAPPLITPPPAPAPAAVAAATPSEPGPSAPAAQPAPGQAPFMPPKPLARKAAEAERQLYPEPGDRVTHFAFGECTVESSDGDRIRLKQDKDERVREVSLAMLRIEPPETDASGRPHYRLLRKN